MIDRIKQHFEDYWFLHILYTLPIMANLLCWYLTGYTIPHFIG